MSDKNEEKEELKVVDRRRFTSEGEPVPGLEDVPEPDSAPAPSPPPEPETPPVTQKPAPDTPTPEQKAYEQAAGGGPEMQFEHLIMSLSTSAMLQLGVLEDPERGPMTPDLKAARQTIDLLGILEQKTRGNLAEKEEKILSQVLSELRMVYVQVSSGIRTAAPDDV